MRQRIRWRANGWKSDLGNGYRLEVEEVLPDELWKWYLWADDEILQMGKASTADKAKRAGSKASRAWELVGS